MFPLRSLSRREALVGLDVGDRHIAVAQAEPLSDGAVRVRHLALEEYDSEAPDRAIAQAIRGVWRRARVPAHTVCSCLRSQSLTQKYFRYPRLSRRELASALRLEAEEALQLPHDKLVIDSHVNRIDKAEGGRADECSVEGILVAVPRDAVVRHVNLLEMAGLYPVIVDTSAMATANLYVQMKSPWVRGAICVVNLSRHSADIAVLFEGNYIYPRTIVTRSGGWQDAAGYLITNIKDGVKYYQFKLGNEPVENVVFTGDIPNRDVFLKAVGAAVGLPTELWNPMRDVDVGAGKMHRVLGGDGENKGPLMTTCLGLALRGES
jgi:Tfp pilus assembly PilM family ATPase